MKVFSRGIILCFLLACGLSASAATLDEIRKQGSVSIAVYNEFFPFNDKGQGIDVDLAQALADSLGVKLNLMPFDAKENVEDDLRNMVWKGTVMGYGPADVMMHVPVASALISRADKARIFAPYYVEKLALAYDPEHLKEPIDLENFISEPVGMEVGSVSQLLMTRANGGLLRDKIHLYPSTKEAVAALQAHKLSAVLAQRGEIEAALGADSKMNITEAPFPSGQLTRWSVGLAVTSANGPLADALTKAIDDLKANGRLEKIFASHGVKWREP